MSLPREERVRPPSQGSYLLYYISHQLKLVSNCFLRSAICFCSTSNSFLYCDMKLSWTISTATLFVFGLSLQLTIQSILTLQFPGCGFEAYGKERLCIPPPYQNYLHITQPHHTHQEQLVPSTIHLCIIRNTSTNPFDREPSWKE